MVNVELTAADGNWQEKIAALQAMLDEIHPQLIEAEAELADRLAVIGQFEFKLRARIGPLTRRLEALKAEINGLRHRLRQMEEAFFFNDEAPDNLDEEPDWSYDPETAAAGEGYRYRETAAADPQELDDEESQTLKQLYRQLARRFHPDLALDEEDRAYRTKLMMAINAAYTVGDLARLQELAQEPDSVDRIEYARTDKQLAQALYIELDRCRRRLRECKEELARLEQHQSARLMKQVAKAAAEDRDLLTEIAQDIQAKIDQFKVERDVLRQQIEQVKNGAGDFGDGAFAAAVFDLMEEEFEDDEEPREVRRHRERPLSWSDDDILDDLE